MRPALTIAATMVVLATCSLDLRTATAAPKSTAADERAAATDVSSQRRARPVTRIEVTPSRRLYRQCIDWYALERRPSGPVVTPHMRCRWALR